MIITCPYSTLKNIEDAYQHSPDFIKPEIKAIRDRLASELEIDVRRVTPRLEGENTN